MLTLLQFSPTINKILTLSKRKILLKKVIMIVIKSKALQQLNETFPACPPQNASVLM